MHVRTSAYFLVLQIHFQAVL